MEPVAVGANPGPDKPKKGHPRLLAPAYERELARQSSVATTYGVHGRHYATVAARALFALEQPGWVPRDEAFAHFVKRNGDLKWTMLSELGRIADEQAQRAVARIVGRQRLPTVTRWQSFVACGSELVHHVPRVKP
jgi:hypothetical protein